jgi:histidinol-phosphate/aromatic aminotransferase/cobyric acid decarboxylase-like protein
MQGCYHGGGFWNEIGARFDRLGRRDDVVNADVLDAWFPPAPSVVAELRDRVEWLSQTSPPTQSEGLVEVISEHLSVPSANILTGAGSSSLIFSAFREWLSPSSRVLLIEPTYGEYEHLCRTIGCQVDLLTLSAQSGFRLDLRQWTDRLEGGEYDLAVLVNPNNPTGGFIEAEILTPALERVPASTRVWIDEAYVDYTGEAGAGEMAAESANVFVVKSLSKGLALSGLRVAHLTGPEAEISRLRRWSPPWAVSLPAQLAAVLAMGEPSYYASRYLETAALREQLTEGLCEIGGEVIEGPANWVLYRLPASSPGAGELVRLARERGVHLRDAGVTAPSLRDAYVRIAVKAAPQQARILATLRELISGSSRT